MTLWSDTPGARVLANRALKYKQRAEMLEHLLSQWRNRWLSTDDDAKGEFDGTEPGMASLLDATDRALYGDEKEMEELFREMPHVAT